MRVLEEILTLLEGHDTLAGEDTVDLIFNSDLSDKEGQPEPSDVQLAALHLWQSFGGEEGEGLRTLLGLFLEARLWAWHNLKANALRSAWDAYPQPLSDEAVMQHAEAIRKKVVVDLRAGIGQHPEMLADAHFVQALARKRHKISYGQTIVELRSSGLPIPADPGLLKWHLRICDNALMYLVSDS
jgi:hypothetical protein